MIQPFLLIKRTRPDAVIPTRGTDLSAGLDVYATIKSADDAKLTVSRYDGLGVHVGEHYVAKNKLRYGAVIEPGSTVMIATGIKVGIPEGYAIFAFGRSGLGIKHGLRLGNSVGLVDEDYAGEIFVGIHNDNSQPQFVGDGDRIAQLVVTPVVRPAVHEADDELFDRFMKNKLSNRGTGGFGSTGS